MIARAERLFTPDRFWVEHYARQGENQWLLSQASGPAARLALASIGCTLRLADVFAGVRLTSGSGTAELPDQAG